MCYADGHGDAVLMQMTSLWVCLSTGQREAGRGEMTC